MALPEADPVKVTEHVPPDRLHEFGLREPAPLDEKVTVPVGTIPDPMSVSATVAVHVEATLTRTRLPSSLPCLSLIRRAGCRVSR